jgi:hypothetical protein
METDEPSGKKETTATIISTVCGQEKPTAFNLNSFLTRWKGKVWGNFKC